MYKQDAGITHILAGGMRRCLFPLLLHCLHYSRDEQPVAPAAIQPACSVLAAHAADRAQHSPQLTISVWRRWLQALRAGPRCRATFKAIAT
jgi:hypothetical protein